MTTAITVAELLDRGTTISVPEAVAIVQSLAEAPPFDSLQDFSRGLARFETEARADVVRGLIERSSGRLLPMTAPRLVSIRPQPAPPPAPVEPVAPVDRRRRGPRADQLRRELRAA